MLETFSLAVLVGKIRCFQWGTSDFLEEKNIFHLPPTLPTKKLAQFPIQACWARSEHTNGFLVKI